MSKVQKFVKILSVASIAFAIIAVALGIILNFTFVGESAPVGSGVIVEYAHFAKYIRDSLVGQSAVAYPSDAFANVSFFSGVFMCLIAVSWIVLMLIRKEPVKVLYGLGSIVAGFIVSFAYFLFVQGVTYNHIWNFLNEMKGGNLALAIIIFVLANLLALSLIALFVIYVVEFIKGTNKKECKCNCEESKECSCEECECGDKKECPCEECECDNHDEIVEDDSKEDKSKVVSEDKTELVEEKDVSKEVDSSSDKKEKAAPAKKSPVKKAAPKAEEKNDEATSTEDKPKRNYKAYHISKHPTLDKWQVKGTGSDKALKLFDTQEQAIQYAKQVAKNQGVSIRVHSKKGRIRSI